jgi:multidrug efflux pump subunit AcrA (membrane-fusion protein)
MRMRRLVIIVLILVALAAAVCVGGGQLAANLMTQNQQPPALPVTPGVAAHLRAQGQVVPARWVELGFAGGGRLAEVPVEAGQAVAAGDLLARLETTALEGRIATAQAELEVARARLEQLGTGPTEAEQKVAQIALAQAEADLERLTAGPLSSDLAAARAAVEEAAREVETARQNLAVVQKSDVVAKNVRDREYEVNWFEVNYAEYRSKFERGEIDQTRLDLEWNALLTAKERLESAQAEAALALGQAEDRLARAEESQRQAQAHVADLQREPDARDLAVAELALEKAQAQWAQLTAGPDAADLKQAEAAVQAAELALAEAQTTLVAASLTAPFTGTVVAVVAAPGEVVGSTPFLTLADLATWQVESVDVDEWLVARIQVGQSVELSFPAFDQKVLAGTVASIAPRAGPSSGSEPFYTVVISLSQPDDELRWGMTARLDFGEEP